MSKRYSGKSFKDSSVKKKPKLTLKEKRKFKKEKQKKLLLQKTANPLVLKLLKCMKLQKILKLKEKMIYL